MSDAQKEQSLGGFPPSACLETEALTVATEESETGDTDE